MKKISIFVVVALLVSLVSATNVYAAALTTEQVNAITTLLKSFGAESKVIEKVEATLSGKSISDDDGKSGVAWCHNFLLNLRIGDATSEVKELITALNNEGVLNLKKDSYDEQVAAAVTAFQEKYASDVLLPAGLKNGTGFAGPSTRAKLNALYGCKANPPVCSNGATNYPHCNTDVAYASILTSSQITNTMPYIIGTAVGVSQIGISISGSSGDKVYGSGMIPVVNGKWSVTVSPALDYGQYKVRVYDENNRLLTSKSLNIVQSDSASPSITVLSPNGGQSWNRSTEQTITWKSSGLAGTETITLYILNSSGPCKLGTTPAPNNIYWVIPESAGCARDNGQYKVRLLVNRASSTSDLGLYDDSDNYFTITSGVDLSPLSVLSPNGGESWQKGEIKTISWSDSLPPPSCITVGTGSNLEGTCPVYTAQLYTISLVPNNSCPPDSMCPAASSATVVIAKGIAGKSYNWTVGKVGAGGDYINDGDYRVMVCRSGAESSITSVCDSSNFHFKIYTGTSVNQPPVIDGVTAPTTLAIGETGTWIVKAHDPENGSLSYAVDWGDNIFGGTLQGYTTTLPLTQVSIFSHSYAFAGTYTVKFKVADSRGLSAETSTTVKIENVSY
ncbi:MAG: hypothetical protein A3H57_04485 [Candidatus Taylorbacteria bacterium RIFCSPLOWO2_02_FULL_43_11]|uniref:PKD domain-containing protein n=1 Tax=Candidatus Taylorbacteria bacterium RIFCSPHIGHO2_02_FULL_43_32b TaxID=1802306 RepID=A0A1G2MQ09_9BACT|nr:MAG: hypothetical protein A2743_01540 [Candidatus Taylorbacteria bacterium RIFCSPHIGHO2_01_FULL_43_47]OHA25072.1 MAG: hypothetical protein A3C72_01165 [Candidatus Taylorbacteria bacterium RIFCSPHIGHO2_02_FULL_43_32b]OHA32022.1 MAG: hypothetical protein A3B08_03155 [Candidatus Taylorbacteria bacterium RIFCSPLOWO2_01_FULL_43_44]OHA37566.1 MAG: hypothetical protein A3H57_04485 [Candidatus Taylorbacteria bacterium RIFCSPLOWO2_02_FULL_43_11]